MDAERTARQTLNIIMQRYRLPLQYTDWVTGPRSAQVWIGAWVLQGVGEISEATASTRVAAREAAAAFAVAWLNQNGYV